MNETIFPIPHDEDEARAWARSIILFTRWGLDFLVPIIPVKGKDNRLRIVPQKEHDRIFQNGYERELKLFLPENPLYYFSNPDLKYTPIEIKKNGPA